MLLRPPLSPRQLGPLPLIAGLAVAEAIDRCIPVTTELKWPNDLFIAGRKVSGVLMQARASGERTEYVNLGIGVNVLTEIGALPPGATSLRAVSGLAIPVEVVERAVMERLTEHYARFVAGSLRPALAAWLDRALFLGEPVTIEQDGRTISGTISGVSLDGALILQTPSGAREIVVGDLTRGPRPAGAE